MNANNQQTWHLVNALSPSFESVVFLVAHNKKGLYRVSAFQVETSDLSAPVYIEAGALETTDLPEYVKEAIKYHAEYFTKLGLESDELPDWSQAPPEATHYDTSDPCWLKHELNTWWGYSPCTEADNEDCEDWFSTEVNEAFLIERNQDKTEFQQMVEELNRLREKNAEMETVALNAEKRWNAEADEHNQWSALGKDEKDALISQEQLLTRGFLACEV